MSTPEARPTPTHAPTGAKWKFIAGGLLILAAVVYLIVSSTQANAQYYLTIDELSQKKAEMANRELRISGAVIGDSIQYDPNTLDLSFDVVHIPADTKEIDAMGGLAEVLHQATLNTNANKLQVVYNGPRPDLLKHEAQAIMTGRLDENGVFHAEELLLKCPSRYEEALPAQAEQSSK
jgi:cytochrome c-type biogenesis protein CcmE